MSTIEKIQQCMNILAGIRPRVDQLNEITYPIVGVINTLADLRDELNAQNQTDAKTDKEE
ncbi:MAG: hypothetical protein II789_05950 [Clostridia bacterium]|nr:hypothetical protein [Clostridia bacterium]